MLVLPPFLPHFGVAPVWTLIGLLPQLVLCHLHQLLCLGILGGKERWLLLHGGQRGRALLAEPGHGLRGVPPAHPDATASVSLGTCMSYRKLHRPVAVEANFSQDDIS